MFQAANPANQACGLYRLAEPAGISREGLDFVHRLSSRWGLFVLPWGFRGSIKVGMCVAVFLFSFPWFRIIIPNVSNYKSRAELRSHCALCDC